MAPVPPVPPRLVVPPVAIGAALASPVVVAVPPVVVVVPIPPPVPDPLAPPIPVPPVPTVPPLPSVSLGARFTVVSVSLSGTVSPFPFLRSHAYAENTTTATIAVDAHLVMIDSFACIQSSHRAGASRSAALMPKREA
jgi:hypothetical protein